MAEQVRLSAVLADISILYATLKEKLDKDSMRAFRDRMLHLRKLIDESLKTLKVENESGVGVWAAGDKPMKLASLKNLDEKLGIEETVELEDFFGNVSNAVIAAQKNLNAFSKDYVQDVEKNHPRIPPTYFAIPSIKAEMKIGFSEMSAKGINVILFKDEKQRKDYGESTITFELVSAPPLPAPPPKDGAGIPAPPSDVAVMQLVEPVLPHDMLVMEDEAELSLEIPSRLILREETREEEDDLTSAQEGLSLARDTLLAAANRLIEAKIGLVEEAELPLLEAEERSAVLNEIVRELESRDEKLEKEFENAREQAVVLKSSKRGRDRYLVLWPGRLEDQPGDSWHELRIYELSGPAEDLSLATDLFSHPPKEKKHLSVKPRRQLLRLKKEEMADLTTNLGDVLMNIITILNKWQDAAKRQP